MKKIFSFFAGIFFLILCGIFISLGEFVPTYDSRITETKIVRKDSFLPTFHYTETRDKPQNTWYIGIEKDIFTENSLHPENICIRFLVEKKKYQECLDTEEADNTGEWYSFPIITPLTQNIAFEVFYNNTPIAIDNIHVYSINTLPDGKKLTFSLPQSRANTTIISRAEWGADESIRYTDHPRQKEAYKKNLAYFARAKTDTELKTIQHNQAINNFIASRSNGLFETMSMIRHENGHRLVYPIQKVKNVNKIIIHHTADSLDKNRSDEEIIRAIYAYHAITRNWGDIGYHYLIGQNGKVYEGRAGGDYLVGIHASYNNVGSVGVSVLGDYEKNPLNSAQEIALKNTISWLSDKYGIDINNDIVGFKKCTNATCWPLQSVTTKALLGHKDVGYTNCPGKNIYPFLSKWRKELGKKKQLIPNTEKGIIEPKPKEEINNLTPKQTVISDLFEPTTSFLLKKDINTTTSTHINNTSLIPKITITKEQEKQKTDIPSQETTKKEQKEEPQQKNEENIRYFGNKFRVKLSYPHKHIELSNYETKIATAFLDYIRKPIYPGTKISVSPLGNEKILLKINETPYELKNFSFSAGVVRIDSWDRIPEWDNKKQYNDNLFRDTIEIFNENGNLTIVNHLPLEWYLKGLGEVSNSDLPEKIKTITVAARSYANFYMQRENRKYSTERYDGNDDPESFQKYIGYGYEKRSPLVSKMVDATRGEIIYYKDITIKPWYFSVSNGKTLSYKEYCEKKSQKSCDDIPYLQSVVDPAGDGKIQSGHGVGISGIGATEFARQGWNYKQIIQYYLTGTEIKK